MKSKVLSFVLFFLISGFVGFVWARDCGVVFSLAVSGGIIFSLLLEIFLSRKKEERSGENERKKETCRITEMIEKSKDSSLDEALYFLHRAGIKVAPNQPWGKKISLPLYFWEINPRLIAVAFVTVVWHDGGEDVNRRSIMRELGDLLGDRAKFDPYIPQVLMNIQKLRLNAVEEMYGGI